MIFSGRANQQAWRVAKAFAYGVIALSALSGPVAACVGAITRVFPTCDIGAPRDDERVALVYAYSGDALSSVSIGTDKENVTEVVDIEIGAADKPHYIALSSGKRIIWRFSGRTDTISRVIVLGSQLSGANRTGVVGLPAGRVRFVGVDFSALRKVAVPICHWFYFACDLSTYFDIPKAGLTLLAGDPPDRRHAADQFVEYIKAGTIRIPEHGNIENDSGRRLVRFPDGRQEMISSPRSLTGSDDAKTDKSHERRVLAINPADVVSPEAARPSDVLPAAPH